MKKKHLIVLIAIAAACLFLIASVFITRGEETRVVFFDIGQGDSIFIDCPNDFQILIDGGPDNTVVEKIGHYMPFYDRTIEMIILTHPDGDHVTGLVEVMERYLVDTVLYTNVASDNLAYQRLNSAMEQKGVEKRIAQAGQKYSIFNSIELNVVFPFENYNNITVDDVNSTSVVVLLNISGVSFLMTGDAPIEKELEIIESGQNIKADVLKVGHHGSKTSTSDELLASVAPKYAVIQSGIDNPFGHPANPVIKRLEDHGIRILRNDLDGDIVMEIDNGQLETK